MKQIQTKTLLAMAAIAALLLSGCTKEPQTEDEGDGTYLSLSIDGVKTATAAQSTRATAVDESAVNDVWVLQFQMNAGSTTEGTLVAKSYLATVADPTKIKFMPKGGDNMVLYLVANSGNSSLFSSTVDGTTLATVKATSVNVTTTAGNNFPTDGSANLPMVGQSATLKLPTTAAVPVTLTRTAAKVALTITNALATGYPQLTVSSVQIKNVPKTYSMQVVNSANGFTDTTYYPAALAGNFTNYTAVSGNISAAGTTSTYYLAPNVRGISSNTSDRLKSDLTAASGQGDYCTYVEILGTTKASATAPAADVQYRLYLGANSTNDFNLEANTAYKVGIELTGINGNDARMTITTDKFDLIQGGTDGDHSGDIGGFEQPAIGDYYYSDGSFSTDLKAGKTATGMIYYINPADPQKYKVMSLDEAATTLSWSAYNTYVVSGAQSDADGKANSAAIKAAFDARMAGVAITESIFDDAFPAAVYCYKYKADTDALGSWHLPAKSELQYLWCAYNGVAPISWGTSTNVAAPADAAKQTLWNNRIKAGGGAKDITSGYFWSSTEISSSTSYAWCVSFSSGYTDYGGKSGTSYVRCVRDL